MPEAYDLTKLDPNSFEHLVNMLALRVLGAGHTGFGPGADGGRDGFFEGEASYPSPADRWSGRWYIQSKFHKPHLSKDPQKWLTEQIDEELKEFSKPGSKRVWPDNWIVATNVDPSGTPMTGAFDGSKKAVKAARPELETHFHIWGGSKILQLLALHPEVAEYYSEFLTPGQVLTSIYHHINDERAHVDTIVRHLLVRQFSEQLYTKLEQAGSDADARPGIHRLFIDLPFRSKEYDLEGLALKSLVQTAARNHRVDQKQPDTKEWRIWQRHPSRARVWFGRGGPGQGKSTIGQYFCQLQRAAFILQDDGPPTTQAIRTIAEEIKVSAEERGFWSASPRIPLTIELKEYAQWFGTRAQNEPKGVLSYLAQRISTGVEQQVLVGTIKRALRVGGWFAVFDGLDEVPHDVKDDLASEVSHFVDDIAVEVNCDLLTLCTSRPQGYSGQFSSMDGPTMDLTKLSPEQALDCARPLLLFGRAESEAAKSIQILEAAIESSSVKELMTTPLQSHIMAVVIRSGGRPPERRWQLFTNFYQVIRRREANRNLPDTKLAKLLREDEQLLKTVHSRLGFILQARAETSRGAQTSLDRADFEDLVRDAVKLMKESDVDGVIQVLMAATTDRLVLVSTPDDGDSVRFDIRPLQEFFAAEFLYESVDADELRQRLEILAGDSHWREVVHFLLSALIENNRRTELAVAVSVLEQINEGGADDTNRLLNRRLGRGAILAARILQEGVLEQDKRIRQKFRGTIEPLAGSTDENQVEPLIQVNQPDSNEWLIAFLLDVLKELNWSESCGAAMVLMEILPDTDPRAQQVASTLLDAPAQYLATIFDYQQELTFGTDTQVAHKWVREMALKLFLGKAWRSLPRRVVNHLITLLQRKEGDGSGESDFELSRLETQLLPWLTSSIHHDATDFDVDCGFVKAAYYPDWTTEGSLEFAHGDSDPRGILALVYRVLKFRNSRTLDNLRLLLDAVAPDFQLLGLLPESLRAQIPIDDNLDLYPQCIELRNLTAIEFESLLDNQHVGSRVVPRSLSLVQFGLADGLDQWMCLLANYPQFAPQFWDEGFWEHLFNKERPAYFDNEEFVHPLVDKLLQYPKLLLQIPHRWGRLIAKNPEREEKIRRAILTASANPADEQFYYARSGTFDTFRLDLPLEAPLLPHLVSALFTWLETYILRQDQYEAVSGISEISWTIQCLVGDDDLEVLEIVDGANYSSNIRAAAMLLHLLRQHPLNLSNENRKQLVELYAPDIGTWFFEAVGGYVGLIPSSQQDAAKGMIGDLLNVARNDFEGRSRLNWLLRAWRETSEAPVHQAGVQQQWLRGE
jgi:hypothetical protein